MSNEDFEARTPFEGRRAFIEAGSFVRADDEFLRLCAMCKKSRLNCENFYVREVEFPLSADENPDDHGQLISRRQPDGSFREFRMDYKIVDGVEAGLMKSEADIPIPSTCTFFDPKDLR